MTWRAVSLSMVWPVKRSSLSRKLVEEVEESEDEEEVETDETDETDVVDLAALDADGATSDDEKTVGGVRVSDGMKEVVDDRGVVL